MMSTILEEIKAPQKRKKSWLTKSRERRERLGEPEENGESQRRMERAREFIQENEIEKGKLQLWQVFDFSTKKVVDEVLEKIARESPGSAKHALG